jgi:hypothetical protein
MRLASNKVSSQQTARSSCHPSSLPCDRRCSLACHHPTLPFLLPVGCCLSIPPTDGGVWGHHLSLIFSGLIQLPLVVTQKMRCQGCGVAIVMTPVPVFASGQFWPSPARGLCASGAAPGRGGGRAGIVLFGAISASSAMFAGVF